MEPNRGSDEAATTATALLLAVGLIATAGLAATFTGGYAAETASAAATSEDTEETQAEPEPVDWEGQLANDACVPAGPHVCYGTSLGEADDRLDTQIGTELVDAELTLTWEAELADTETLEVTLASAHTECDGRCLYYHVKATAQGTSPLTLEVDDLSLEQDGDTWWIMVDAPDRTPQPLHSDGHTEQPFTVSGELTPTTQDAVTNDGGR